MAQKRIVLDTFRDTPGSQLTQIGTTGTGSNAYTANGANPTNNFSAGGTVTTAGTVVADRIQVDFNDATPMAFIMDNIERLKTAVLDWYARK